MTMVMESNILKTAAAVSVVPAMIAPLEKPLFFDNPMLFAVCVVCSTASAMIGLVFFPTHESDTEQNKLRRISLKLGGSMLSGIFLIPAFVDEWDVVLTGHDVMPTVPNIMACSFLWCFAFVWMVHRIFPLLEKWGMNRAKGK